MKKLNKIIKGTICLTLALGMVVTAVPVSASELSKSDNSVVKVSEAGTITATYYDNGKQRTKEGCKEFTNNMSEGWYVLNKNVSTNDAVVINGKVNLILANDTILNANNGIYITKGSDLIIWDQLGYVEDGLTGTIIAHPDDGPGIGSVRDTMGGNLTINGGIIDCKGGSKAAGIGGGRGESSGFGNITINGGYVKAEGGNYSAGLGRGHRNWKFGVITINGGEVEAIGGSAAGGRTGGAGIGGSEDRGMPPVIINGGKVTAKGGFCGAGIGGGAEGHQVEKLTINGGDVTAIGNGGAAAIGGGESSLAGGFNGAEVEINGGKVTAKTNGNSGCAIGGGSGGVNGPITINGGTVNATFVSPMDFKVCRGCAIGSSTGKTQGGPITINGGVVNAVNEGRDPAIGGSETGGNITINGGIVNAIAKQASGISGNGSNGSVKITGGNVTSVSNGSGAGIGCSNGGKVTISGGYVIASSGAYHDAVWLGGAYGGASAGAAMGISVAVSTAVTGIVYALSSSEKGGAGIGGENGENGGNVKITGGTVIANSVMKGAAAIGRGLGGKSDGTHEIYDSAEVIAGKDARNGEAVKKEDRVSACRNDFFAVITECTHEGATYKDENVRVHTATCPYCNAKGRDLAMGHYFNQETHKCVCGRTERKVDVHVDAINMSKDEASRNIDIKAAETEDLNKNSVRDGESFYVVEGDMLTVYMKNSSEIQDAYFTCVINGEEKNVPIFLYDKTVEGYQVYKYKMPNVDCKLTLKVSRKLDDTKPSTLNSMPYARKDRVYNGQEQTLAYPGVASNGTLYYAIGDNTREAPTFDGNDSTKKESERKWQKEVPSAIKAGKYYVWYQVVGDSGYEGIDAKCIECEIKPVISLKDTETSKKGLVRDTTDYMKKSSATIKYATDVSYDVNVEVVNNGINGNGKANIEAGKETLKGANNGDKISAKAGENLVIDVPYDHDYLCKVEGVYMDENGELKSLTTREYNVGKGGSVHTVQEMPHGNVKLTLTFTRNNHETKTVSYDSPKANTGLVCTGKPQALVKAGHTSDGTFYYALGDNKTTPPEFDGRSNSDNKKWCWGVPEQVDPGTYYVWYKIVGSSGYADVEPKCIEVEIKKNPKQKQEAKKNEEVKPTGPISNPYNIKPTDDKKLEDVVDVTPEEKEEGVNLWLEEVDITDTLPDEDKINLYDNFPDFEVPLVVDMSMYMQVGESDPIDITDLVSDIELSIDVPAQYVKDGRTFTILRLNEDDTRSIFSITPTGFDKKTNTLTFKTDKISPFAIVYKDEKTKAEALNTPSLVSPKAKEGLYYSGEDMELAIEGKAVGGTIYYALSEDANEEPTFDGLSSDPNRKWTTNVPKAKDVGSYYVWYKVKGDEGYTDLDASCIVSEIMEVPESSYENVKKEKGEVIDITNHPDVADRNTNNVVIEKTDKNTDTTDSDTSNPTPNKAAVPTPKKTTTPDNDKEIIPEEVEEGMVYWIEVTDMTDFLTQDDIDTIYAQYWGYIVGKLYDLTLTFQWDDEEPIDVDELDEPIKISFTLPEDMAKSDRQYVIYMLGDDNDFFNPIVIYPSEYNESMRRLTFETTKIKPFILGYSDGEDWTDFWDDDNVTTVARSAVYTDEIPNTVVNTSTVTTEQKNEVKNDKPNDKLVDNPIDTQVNKPVAKASVKTPDFSQEAYTTNLKTKSAKTGDDDILSIIIRFIYNVASCIIKA